MFDKIYGVLLKTRIAYKNTEKDLIYKSHAANENLIFKKVQIVVSFKYSLFRFHMHAGEGLLRNPRILLHVTIQPYGNCLIISK